MGVISAESSAQQNNNKGEIKLFKNFGFYNFILVLFTFFSWQLVIENYVSYGIIKGPLEITLDLAEFIRANWFVLFILAVGTIIQFFAIYFTEILLARNYLTERTGLIWQGCNVLSMLFVSSALFSLTQFNPVAGHLCTGYLGYIFCKFLSYAWENKRARENSKSRQKISDNENNPNEEEKYSKDIPYPESVTLVNLFNFMVCSGNFIYNPPSLVRTQRNFKKVILYLLSGLVIYFLCAFMTYQYVLPEVELAKLYLNKREFVKLVGQFCKTLVPVNIIWFLHYHCWCLKCFLPLHGYMWGFQNEPYMFDWWNCGNVTEFWSKWNYQMHVVLKKYFFVPLFKKGYSKLAASFVVGIATGIIHEYLVSVPLRSSFSLPFLAMMIQIPFAKLTSILSKSMGRNVGNLTTLGIFSINYNIVVSVLYYNCTYNL